MDFFTIPTTTQQSMESAIATTPCSQFDKAPSTPSAVFASEEFAKVEQSASSSPSSTVSSSTASPTTSLAMVLPYTAQHSGAPQPSSWSCHPSDVVGADVSLVPPQPPQQNCRHRPQLGEQFSDDLVSLDWLLNLRIKCSSIEAVAATNKSSQARQVQPDRQAAPVTASAPESQSPSKRHKSSGKGSHPQPSEGKRREGSSMPVEAVRPSVGSCVVTDTHGALPSTSSLIMRALVANVVTRPMGMTSLQIVKHIAKEYPGLTKRDQQRLKTAVRHELVANPAFVRARKPAKAPKPSSAEKGSAALTPVANNACWVISASAKCKAPFGEDVQQGGKSLAAKKSKTAKQAKSAKRRQSEGTGDEESNASSGDDDGDLTLTASASNPKKRTKRNLRLRIKVSSDCSHSNADDGSNAAFKFPSSTRAKPDATGLGEGKGIHDAASIEFADDDTLLEELAQHPVTYCSNFLFPSRAKEEGISATSACEFFFPSTATATTTTKQGLPSTPGRPFTPSRVTSTPDIFGNPSLLSPSLHPVSSSLSISATTPTRLPTKPCARPSSRRDGAASAAVAKEWGNPDSWLSSFSDDALALHSHEPEEGVHDELAVYGHGLNASYHTGGLSSLLLKQGLDTLNARNLAAHDDGVGETDIRSGVESDEANSPVSSASFASSPTGSSSSFCDAEALTLTPRATRQGNSAAARQDSSSDLLRFQDDDFRFFGSSTPALPSTLAEPTVSGSVSFMDIDILTF